MSTGVLSENHTHAPMSAHAGSLPSPKRQDGQRIDLKYHKGMVPSVRFGLSVISQCDGHVRFGPIADSCTAAINAWLRTGIDVG
jgi:hypothetical protein